MHVAEKMAIGMEAAKLVSDGETIFIDASSTVFYMLPYINHVENLTIVTNGIHTAMEIQRYSNFKTVLVGGVLRSHSGAIEGLLCEEMLRKISGDSYFVSGNGFSLAAGLTGNNFYELELKRRFAEALDQCFNGRRRRGAREQHAELGTYFGPERHGHKAGRAKFVSHEGVDQRHPQACLRAAAGRRAGSAFDPHLHGHTCLLECFIDQDARRVTT